MSDDPLLEWNRLHIENTENAILESLVESISGSVIILDRFSDWVSILTGATFVILISNIQSILPYLSVNGFKFSALMLVISAILGIASKYFSMLCQINIESTKSTKDAVISLLEKHSIDEEKIINAAEEQGIQLKTDIDFPKVADRFYRLFPKCTYWFFIRKNKKIMESLDSRLKLSTDNFFWFSMLPVFQAIFYVFFIISIVCSINIEQQISQFSNAFFG